MLDCWLYVDLLRIWDTDFILMYLLLKFIFVYLDRTLDPGICGKG